MRSIALLVMCFVLAQGCGSVDPEGYARVTFRSGQSRGVSLWLDWAERAQSAFGRSTMFTNNSACAIDRLRIETGGLGVPQGQEVVKLVSNPPTIPAGSITTDGGSFPTFTALVPKGIGRKVIVTGVFAASCLGGTQDEKHFFVGRAKKNGNDLLNIQSNTSVDLDLVTTSYAVKLLRNNSKPAGTGIDNSTLFRLARLQGGSCSGEGRLYDLSHGIDFTISVTNGSGQPYVYPLIAGLKYRATYDCGGSKDYTFTMGPGGDDQVQEYNCSGSTCTY